MIIAGETLGLSAVGFHTPQLATHARILTSGTCRGTHVTPFNGIRNVPLPRALQSAGATAPWDAGWFPSGFPKRNLGAGLGTGPPGKTPETGLSFRG